MSIQFRLYLQGHSAMLVFCLLPSHSFRPSSHSTSLSSPSHLSFLLFSFVSQAPSFSPLARANWDILLNSGTKVLGRTAKRHRGRRGIWDGELHEHRPSRLVNFTHPLQLHTQYSCLQPPPPIAITSSPAGAKLEPGEKQHRQQSGVKTLLGSFLCRCVVRWVVWCESLVAVEPARLIWSVIWDRVCPDAVTWPLTRRDSGAVKQAAARDP